MSHPVEPQDYSAELNRVEQSMLRLQARSAAGAHALGVPEWDWRLARLGRDWLAARADQSQQLADVQPSAPSNDVYLATQIYEIGGHTALIGDMVGALDPGGAHSHVVVTNRYGQNAETATPGVIARLGVPGRHVTVLEDGSRADAMDRLFERLLELRPNRLFLLHHSHDPLAAAVAQPNIAAARYLVHHADSTPSFAMHVPGVRIIDLFPNAAAMTRVLGRRPALLSLTADDPGPRPIGFLTRGALVTASSGSAHKFATPYACTYADAVAVVLQAGGGRHVHVGPLDQAALEMVSAALSSAGIAADRFIHVASVPSVSRALWEHDCDLYLASFPIDGARTRVEVLASATPYLRHSTALDEWTSETGDAVWRTLDGLREAIRAFLSPDALDRASASARGEYDRAHHPDVFRATLINILSGGDGADDPDLPIRMDRARDALLRAFSEALLRDTHVAESVDSAHEGLTYLRGRIDVLESQLRAAEARISQPPEIPPAVLTARGVRGRMARWLFRR